jgi:hypothetical protein
VTGFVFARKRRIISNSTRIDGMKDKHVTVMDLSRLLCCTKSTEDPPILILAMEPFGIV